MTIPKPRRSQAERSADTRTKLIDAAIACLHRVGYSATSVTLVGEEAGVSRGAMTHQFPAKTDLMIAVVRAAFKQEAEMHSRTAAAQEPMTWMRSLHWLMWDIYSSPASIAVTEIMLAARSDEELGARLRAMQAELDQRGFDWMEQRRAAAHMAERPDGKAIHRLFVAAARGLAIEAVFMKNTADVEASLVALGQAMAEFYPELKE